MSNDSLEQMHVIQAEQNCNNLYEQRIVCAPQSYTNSASVPILLFAFSAVCTSNACTAQMIPCMLCCLLTP